MWLATILLLLGCIVAYASDDGMYSKEATKRQSEPSLIQELSGQIEEWPQGKIGQIRLDLRSGERINPESITASVDRLGKFQLNLPIEQFMDNFLNIEMNSSPLPGISYSNLNARSASLRLEVSIEGVREGYLRLQTRNQFGIYYNNTNVSIVYYDSDTVIKGIFRRSFGDLIIDMQLRKGWNTVSTVIPDLDSGQPTIGRTEPIPKDAKWFLFWNP
jgi:hypothetical protein